jgi:hypothetical protein
LGFFMYGAVSSAATRTVGAFVGRLRRSFTHLQVRSLPCSPSAFAATAQVADARVEVTR